MLYLWSWANPGADIEYWCNYILIPHASPYTPHWHTQANTPSLASPQNTEYLESTLDLQMNLREVYSIYLGLLPSTG